MNADEASTRQANDYVKRTKKAWRYEIRTIKR